MSADTPETFAAKLQSVRVPLWLPLLLGALLVVVFIWKQWAMSAAEAERESQRIALTEQAAREKAALLARANEAIARNSDAAHRLMGATLAWSVRGEKSRGNLGQIDEFFGELVRNERIQQAALADHDGQILLSSDRKLQGARFADHFPVEMLGEPTVAIHPGKDGTKYLVMPILGLTSRTGSVILVYRPEPALTDP